MKRFCENCNDTMEYSIKMSQKEKIIKGRKLNYIGKIAYCNECKEEIFVSEIRDYNLKKLDDAYRLAEDIINVDDIKNILSQYDIGKRPLSLLLGWGEGTLTRYIDGDVPTKPYSDMLKRILEDKDYYRDILDKNKGKISAVTYRKSITAIEGAK